MSLKDSFCPSPWFHMRINNNGSYEFCRWAERVEKYNIQTIHPIEYFQNTVQPIRTQFLNGERPTQCHPCYNMEKHGKVSGRQKQLLKIGVREEFFEKSLQSSPWATTLNKQPCTQLPQDWQIDLGNFCNSSCVFCDPKSSSRLAAEWKTLGFIDKMPPPNWVDNPELLNKFLITLSKTKSIRYLHFIGGETVITPSFKKILRILIDTEINKNITIGFTTNLISWDDEVIDLLKNFQGLNLGVSVEAIDKVNDYIRFPSKIETVLNYYYRWVELAKKFGWLIQIRTTPSLLSIHKLTTVYDLAWDTEVAVESCNFLFNPKFLKPSVLPIENRKPVIKEISKWISDHSEISNQKIINTRDPNNAKTQIIQDLTSYLNYLNNEPDESFMLPEMCKFLNSLETNRKNSILDYIPEYEQLFRTNGYQIKS